MKTSRDPSVIPATSELLSGELYWKYFTLADLAHLEMLVKAGVVNRSEKIKCRQDILDLFHIGFKGINADPQVGDLFKNREKWLTQNRPERASWFSMGRARREANTVAFNLLVREKLPQLIDILAAICNKLIKISEEHQKTLMPDYTYLQPAQPSTFGHYILSFVPPLIRDLHRLSEVFHRFNKCPGGIGSTNGSSLALDRNYLSKVLGFTEPVLHTRDAMWQADLPLEVLSVLTSTSLTISRMSDDFHVWCSQEFGFIQLREHSSRKSVIMPQKKNPYYFSFARSLVSQVLGSLNKVAISSHTTTGQIDNRLVPYQEVPMAINQMITGLEVLQFAIEEVEVVPEKMIISLESFFVEATDIVNYLIVHEKLDYTAAYKIVHEWSSESDDPSKMRRLKKIYKRSTGKNISATPGELDKLFESIALVEARKELGAASPGAVTSAAKYFRSEVKKSRNSIKSSLEVAVACERTLLGEK